MLILDLNLQQPLMIIALALRPLQHPHLILVQPPPSRILQLAPANLGLFALLLGRPDARLEARLHADAQRRVEGDAVGVAAHIGRRRIRLGRRRRLDGDEGVAKGLDLERAGGVCGGDEVERFDGGDGF